MEIFIVDVLSLVVRWLHIITGIAWVGASFYFIWLDNSLEEAPAWKREKGIKGDLWSFHGGGIYEVAKYQVGPSQMPQRLHWFYWEAYSTWLSGMTLLVLVYYLQASTYLLAPDAVATAPLQGIAVSLLFFVVGYLGYEVLVRSGLADRPWWFSACVTLWISMLSWLSVQVFSDRAAYIHMGIVLGTIMVANVFFGIIPAQRKFVKDIDAGLTPEPEPLRMAKLRSTHNNYFTLPVLFCMISNHYPFLYGHRYNWLILIAICVITAGARQYFNLRHKGIVKPQILVLCGVLFVGLMGAVQWDQRREATQLASVQVSELEAMSLISKHCTGCHATTPTFPGFAAPPLGVILTTPAEVKRHADKAKQALSTNYMPLGNISALTLEERQKLVAWLSRMPP
jgi:uncharacterized membrane protein